MNKKINLLVIPDLFPKDESDVSGVFIIDYLKSVKEYCNIYILNIKLRGKQKGVYITNYLEYIVCNYVMTNKEKVKSGLKEYFYWKAMFNVVNIVDEYFPSLDIIHAHGSVISAGYARIISNYRRIPYLITEHTQISRQTKLYIKKVILKRNYNGAQSILPVSNHLKNQILSAQYNIKNIEVIYNPVDTDIFNLENKEQNTHKMLFVSRLIPAKGALNTVLAFEKICCDSNDYELHIIGDGYDYIRINNYLSTRKLLKRKVILYGYKNKREISQYMKKCDFLVLPTQTETFGIVIAEALSSGLPVITTKFTAPPEFVGKGEGILIDPNDIDEIANAMKIMIDSYKSYSSNKLHENIYNRFGYKAFGKRLFHIYKKSIKEFNA